MPGTYKDADTELAALASGSVAAPTTVKFLTTIDGVGDVIREANNADILALLRNMGLHQPEQLTAADNFSIAAVDSGRLIMLNAATAKVITLSNVGAVRVYLHNIGTANWTFSGALTTSVIEPGQGGWLEKLASNNWRFDNLLSKNRSTLSITNASPTYTAIATDSGKLIATSGAGAKTFNLSDIGGYEVDVFCIGGTITLTGAASLYGPSTITTGQIVTLKHTTSNVWEVIPHNYEFLSGTSINSSITTLQNRATALEAHVPYNKGYKSCFPDAFFDQDDTTLWLDSINGSAFRHVRPARSGTHDIYGARYFWLASNNLDRRYALEALVNVKVGSVISAGASAYFASGSWRLQIIFYDALGAIISSHNGTTISGAAGVQILPCANITIPANTTHVMLNVQRISGTSAEIYALYGNIGSTLDTDLVLSLASEEATNPEPEMLMQKISWREREWKIPLFSDAQWPNLLARPIGTASTPRPTAPLGVGDYVVRDHSISFVKGVVPWRLVWNSGSARTVRMTHTFASNITHTPAQAIGMWVWIEDVSKINGIVLRLLHPNGSNTTPDTVNTPHKQGSLRNGLNLIYWQTRGLRGSGFGSISSIEIEVITVVNTASYITPLCVFLDVPQKARAIFVHDGGERHFLVNAYPELVSLGVPTTWALNPKQIIDSTGSTAIGARMTLAQLRAIAGDTYSSFSWHSWQVSDPTQSMTPVAIRADAKRCLSFLTQEGLIVPGEPIWRAAHLQNLANNAIAQKNYLGISGLATGNTQYDTTTWPFFNPWNLPRRAIHNISSATLNGYFTELNGGYSTTFFYTHSAAINSGQNSEINTANDAEFALWNEFKSLVTSNSSTIEWTTYADLIRQHPMMLTEQGQYEALLEACRKP